MTNDPELVASLRQAYSHPVSEEQAQAARMAVVRGVALPGLVLLAVGYYSWSREPRLGSLVVPLTLAGSFAWNAVVRYRVARPRTATPVPDDVLALAVRDHARCRACRTIVTRSAFFCPSCGNTTWLGPGFWVALVVALTAFAIVAWWYWP